MLLDIKSVLDGEKNKLDFCVSLEKKDCEACEELFPDLDFVFPIIVTGEVKNMAGYMVLCESSRIEFHTLCARCAEPTASNLELSLEKSIATGDVSRDNDDYIFIEDMKLDITTPLFEEMLLEMPSKILCREDCRGLCPRCGKNLNEGGCDCKQSEGDPRLAILKTLLEK